MTTPALLEILSEAAVELENAYGPDNVVAKRVRRTMAELHDPKYWDKRVAAAGQIDLAAEIKELGTNLMYAAAGRMPPRKGTT